MTEAMVRWSDFTGYRDSFLEDIYLPDRKHELLSVFLERYEDHHVFSAKQAARWVDSTTNNLNANNVWNLFPRYGTLCLVQKIYDKQHENRLFLLPLLRWLDLWEGNPGLPPTGRDLPGFGGPAVGSLGEREAAEAVGILHYAIAHLEDGDAVDMKEALLYSRLVTSGAVNIDEPAISVEMRKLDAEEFEEPQPSSYEALSISGEIGGSEMEIYDEEQLERTLRQVLNLLALSGCYHQKAAQTGDRDEEATPASVHDSSEAGAATGEAGTEVTEPDQADPYSPYVIDKTDFIKDSEPPTITIHEDTEAIEFDFQLGPTWVRWSES